jgi:hypothetical protein
MASKAKLPMNGIQGLDEVTFGGLPGVRPAHVCGSAAELEQTEISVSSLVDTWLLLRAIESGGDRR